MANMRKELNLVVGCRQTAGQGRPRSICGIVDDSRAIEGLVAISGKGLTVSPWNLHGWSVIRCITFLLLLPGLVVADGVKTTGDLRLACKTFIQLIDGDAVDQELVSDAIVCSEYVQGIADVLYVTRSAGLKWRFTSCIPEGSSPYEAARIFVGWADRNPERWAEGRTSGLLKALHEAWPCRKPDQTVRQVQIILISLGYSPGNPDGRVGGKTGAAIRKFQKDRGLPVDGKVSAELHTEILRAAEEEGLAWRLQD